MTFLRSYHRPAFKRRLLAGNEPHWLTVHTRRTYVRAAVLSFPFWVSRAALSAIDSECRRLTRSTGIPHEVDHIIPINHPLVCGLTVPWNLQIITQHKNASKGGYWREHELPHVQIELFERPASEQYQLAL